MDLRAWDFSRGDVPLLGEWEFLPGKLLVPGASIRAEGFRPRQVPDQWRGDDAGGTNGRGAGTYRLILLLPPTADELALRFSTVSTAVAFYANGVKIGGAGLPAVDSRAARALFHPNVLRFPSPDSGRIELVALVSNHEYRAGGLWRPMVIGPAAELAMRRIFRLALAIGLGSGICAMAIHSFLLYATRRRDPSYLYFGVFAFTVALRSLVTGEYALMEIFPLIPFELLIRLEYVTAYCSYPAAVFFFFTLFSAEAGKGLRILLVLPHLFFVALIPWAPLPLLTRSVLFYYPLAYASILITAILVLARAAIRKRPGGLLLLLGGVIVALSAVNDMLFSSFVVGTGNLLPLALAVFIFLQDYVLSRRFGQAFDEVEKLTEKLTLSNELLLREVDGHRQARVRLEVLLHEKETHLQEIHHRIKNGLQIVSSIAALQAHRAAAPETAQALGALRQRIGAISLVHEKLYDTRAGESVDLEEYAGELLRRLAAGLGAESPVEVRFECPPIVVPMDLCADIGLILAELVTNSFRHAFGAGVSGRLRVTIGSERGEVLLQVEDSGPGYPPDFSPERAGSLGFKIITSLVRKRRGRVVIAPSGSAKTEIRIPLDEPERDELELLR